MKRDDWMLVATIRGAHGVRGELQLELHTDFPDRFANLDHVYLGPAHSEYKVDRERRRPGVTYKGNSVRTTICLIGVTSREAAQELNGLDVSIPRDAATPLPEGQFYADEIEGLTVETESGQEVGTVESILSTGANDVYILSTPSGERLIPAIRDVVVKIDPPAGRIVIRTLDGLLDP